MRSARIEGARKELLRAREGGFGVRVVAAPQHRLDADVVAQFDADIILGLNPPDPPVIKPGEGLADSRSLHRTVLAGVWRVVAGSTGDRPVVGRFVVGEATFHGAGPLMAGRRFAAKRDSMVSRRALSDNELVGQGSRR